MVKKITTPEELKAKLKENALSHVRSAKYFEPTRTFNVGDKVQVGHLVDCTVTDVIDNYIYEIRSINEKTKEYHYNYFAWYDVHSVVTEETNFKVDKRFTFGQINFMNSDLSSIIHKVIGFGVDLEPEYQRGYVWEDADGSADCVICGKDYVPKGIDINDKKYNKYGLEIKN